MIAADIVNGEVSPDLTSLWLRNASGTPAVLSAERLRLSCMCAHCKRARLDGRFPSQFPGIGIVGVGDLGYGLNIAFSDGHNRGIYPKSYLWELAAV
ncbi:gamma-butyrobetaine hydroxylase-like domain-containing protein [Bradyrhizobium sp. HKCCYLS2033]|uniref:gamma-butyrobetaine hydroxylase-like domain-containing protein n=1 Tax=unclassified Bradyrhizobium TaxID=2631580 RepID=UPI003EB7B36F